MKKTTTIGFGFGTSTDSRIGRRSPARLAHAAGEMFDALESRRLLIAGPYFPQTYVAPSTVAFMGQPVTVYPVAASSSAGAISRAMFFFDTNNDGALQDDQSAPVHDRLIGMDTSADGGWSATIPTNFDLGFHPGDNRVFVQVFDARGLSFSRPAVFSISGGDLPSSIGALTGSPNPVTRGSSITLTAQGMITPSAPINSVEFSLSAGGNGTFQLRSFNASGANPYSVAVGDFNGDGIPDMATANVSDNSTSVFLGHGDGTFDAAVNYATGPAPYTVAIADFNLDGKADLVTANSGNDSVSVLYGNGNGTFQAPVGYGVGSNPRFVTTGDFNGDGRPDLAVANKGGSSVSILVVNPSGTFRPAVNFFTGSAPRSITVGDFNHDSKLDLAVINVGNDNVSVLIGLGDGSFQSPASYNAGSNPYYITSGDFNGDGRPDLAVANESSNNVSVLLGNADGTFQDRVNYNTGSLPRSVAVGDFNSDGKPDLVVANRSSSTLSVLFGNGNGTFQNQLTLAVDSGPQTVAVADVNRDGVQDLVVSIAGISGVNVILGNSSFTPGRDRVLGTSTVSGNQAAWTLNTAGLTPGPHLVFARPRDIRGSFGMVSAQTIWVSNRNPTIASVSSSVNPVVSIGATFTLTASGVSDPDGSVARVRFYRAADYTNTTFDLSTATLVGEDSLAAGGYSAVVDTRNLALGFHPGSNRIFAVVTDNDGGTAVASTLVRVNAPPTIDYLDGPSPVVRGSAATITAFNVVDGTESPAFTGSISNVQFYLDSNQNGFIDAADRLLGAGTRLTGTSQYRITFSTAGFALGDHAIMARATDGNGAVSSFQTFVLTVINAAPTLAGATVTPATIPFLGQNITIAATTPADSDGTIVRTRFYLDSNFNNTLEDDQSQPNHDRLIGEDTSAAGGWSLTLATSNDLNFGPNNGVWVQIIDSNGASTARSATFNITAFNGPAHIGSLQTPVLPVARGRTARLSASGIFDGDGSPTSVEFYLNTRNDATFQPELSGSSGLNPYSVISGDVNRDGIPDLISANHGGNNVTVRLGDGTGSFGAPGSFPVGLAPRNVSLADFNGDGKPDLVTANSNSNNVSVLIGNGDGSFQPAINIGAGSAPFSATVADFNGDGKPDIAAANFNSGGVSIIFGNGDGTFYRDGGDIGVTGSLHSIATGDFNGDGKADLAVVSYFNQNLAVLLGNGNGTLRTPVFYDVGANPVFVSAADVSGDAKTDLIVANSGDSTVSVLLGTGTGTFLDHADHEVGSTPYAAAVADINGDGIPDIVTGSYSSGTGLSILFGAGGGAMQDYRQLNASGAPISVAIADFNRDGTPDLAYADGTGTNVSVRLGDTGFITGQDRFLGSATVSGGQAFLDISTAGLPAGPITVFAIARDNRNAAGSTTAAILNVADVLPTIGSLSGSPNPVINLGDTLTLTAGSVADADGRITRVEFFADSNDNGTFDPGADPILGVDNSSAGGYTLAFNTGNPAFGLVPGNRRFFARAIDNDGGSTVRAALVRINARPFIGSVNPSAPSVSRGSSITFTATSVIDGVETPAFAGTISGVQFYLDLNNNGNIDSSDRLLGAGARQTGTNDFRLTVSTAGMALGPAQVLARATDNNTLTSDIRSVSFTVNNTAPTFSALTVTPGVVPFEGQTVTLSVVSPSDPDGSIARVYFFLDTNNDGILQSDQNAIDNDHFIGLDTSAAGGWNTAVSANDSLGFRPGTNRVFAQVIDNDGSAFVRAATFTISAVNIPANGAIIPPAAPVVRGSSATITLTNLVDFDGSLTTADFYLSAGGNGLFQVMPNVPIVAPDSVIVGDFNRDGIPDLASTDFVNNQIQVALGTGGGNFGPLANFSVGAAPNVVASGDFNNDGILDLVSANDSNNGGVSVLLGNGDGTFQAAATFAQTFQAFWVSVGDLNRDGRLDLAVTGDSDNFVNILLGNGDGTFQPLHAYETGDNPLGTAIADFNGDGIPDVATANWDANTVSILLGAGDGTLRPQTAFPTGTNPSSLGVGDFNGDGRPDLAVTTSDQSNLSILLGNGNGTFRARTGYQGQSSDYYASVATGDFNGDGRLDLAATVNQAGGVAVRFGNGDGTFSGETIYPTGDYPDFVTAADINGDGATDLLVSNFNSDSVSILRGFVDYVPGRDRLLGTAAISGGQATFTFSTAGLPAGQVTVFARPRDNRNAPGWLLPTTVTIANRAPTIASLSGAPNPVVNLGDTFTLTAGAVADADGSVSRVEFYFDSNGNGIVDPGSDPLLGADYTAAGGYSLAVNSGNSALGITTGDRSFLARVIDNNGGSATAATLLRINARPVLGQFTLSTPSSQPIFRSGNFTLTLSNVTDDSGIAGISIYRDSDGDGAFTAADLFLGAASRLGPTNTWNFTRPGSSLVVGTYKLFVKITDTSGATIMSQMVVTVI